MNFSFYMVCAWLFITLGRPQDIFEWIKIIHPGDIAAGLAVLSFFLSSARQQTKPLSPELKLFTAFFAIAIICTPFGYYPKKSLLFLFDFGKVFIFIFLISNHLTDENHFATIVHVIMLSAFALAFSAIIGNTVQVGRIGGGSTYDANDLAMIMVIALPIAIVEIMRSGPRIWKIFCLIGGISCLATIIATQSRGGLLGLAVIAVMFFFMKGIPIPKGKVLIVLGVLGGGFLLILTSEYKERIQTIFEERISDMQAGSGRVLIWRRALVIARDNPVLGVGPDSFMTAYGDYLSNQKFPQSLYEDIDWPGWQTAHNSYLLVLTELGVPGFLVYLAIIIRSFRNLNRFTKRSISNDLSTDVRLLATGLKVSLSAFLVCAFFLTQTYNIVLFLYCALSGEMIRIGPLRIPEEPSRT